jgi:hypothetical protein
MHKRNLTLTALFWAGVVTVAFLIFPRIYHGSIGWVYFPSVALSVVWSHIFGGNPHSPSAVTGWSSFAVYTIFYWVVFLIIYVLLLEFYLLRKILDHLDEAKQHLKADKPDTRHALEHIGQGLAELEARRRRHFLLQPLDLPDLKEAPHLLAARAITRSEKTRPVKHLLKKLNKRLAREIGSTQAAVAMAKLREDARIIAPQDLPKGGHPNEGSAPS